MFMRTKATIQVSLVKWFSVAIVAAIVVGCANPLLPLVDRSGADTGTVRISVGQEGATAKTVYPTVPEFSKYVLSFASLSGLEAPNNLEIGGGATSTVIDLDPGDWDITAYGYTWFQTNEVVVAEGNTVVSVQAGQAVSASITIRSSIDGVGGAVPDNGLVAYTVGVPQGLGFDSYRVTLQLFDQPVYVVDAEGVVANESGEFVLADDVSLAPGYYLMTIRLESDRALAVRMEIIHVYPNMVSEAAFHFTENDLMTVIKLSGSLQVTINGVAQDAADWHVMAFTDQENPWASQVGSRHTNESGEWSMLVEPFAAESVVYFRVGREVDGQWREYTIPDYWIGAQDSDVSGIGLVVNVDVLTLSGSLSVTINGEPKDTSQWQVTAFTEPGDWWWESSVGHAETAENGQWSMEIEAFETVTNVYFRVEGHVDGHRREFVIHGEWWPVHNTNVTPVDLVVDVTRISLSGSLSVTINGEMLDTTDWRVAAFTDPEEQWYSEIGFTHADGAGNWSVMIDPLGALTNVYFRVEGQVDGHWQEFVIHGEWWPVHDTDVAGIVLVVDVTQIMLSGSLSVTIDGVVQNTTDWWVNAFVDPHDSDIGHTGTDEHGNWFMPIEPFVEATEVFFEVGTQVGEDDWVHYRVSGSFLVHGASISNIELVVDRITVAGTVSVTVDGHLRAVGGLVAFTNPDNILDSFIEFTEPGEDYSWTISAERFDSPTQVYFQAFGPDDMGPRPSYPVVLGPVTVHNTPVTGVELIVAYDTVAVSGTLAFDGMAVQDLDRWMVGVVNNSSPESIEWSVLAFDVCDADAAWELRLPQTHEDYQVWFFAYDMHTDSIYLMAEASSFGTQNVTGVQLSFTEADRFEM